MKRAIILFLCLLTLPLVAGAATTVYPDSTILENIKEIRFDTTYTNNCDEGVAYWNQDDATLNIGITGDVCLQVGQEQLTRVRNNSGATIADGSVVLITGSHGQLSTIGLANATTEAASSKTFGMATEDILNNSNGYVTTFGIVRSQNTSAFAVDDTIWLSATPGQIQNTPSITPNHATFIGWIATVHATEGKILISIQNGFELYELHDVLISGVQADDSLLYNGTYWENVPHTFAELYYHNDDATLDFSTTTALLNVTGLTNGVSNNMTLNDTNGSIAAVDTDTYKTSLSASFQSGSAADFDLHIGVDGVDQDKCHANRRIGTGTDVGNAGLTCLLELTAGEVVTFMVNSAANETIKFEALNLNLTRMP